jgi:hypothetical protein
MKRLPCPIDYDIPVLERLVDIKSVVRERTQQEHPGKSGFELVYQWPSPAEKG